MGHSSFVTKILLKTKIKTSANKEDSLADETIIQRSVKQSLSCKLKTQ